MKPPCMTFKMSQKHQLQYETLCWHHINSCFSYEVNRKLPSLNFHGQFLYGFTWEKSEVLSKSDIICISCIKKHLRYHFEKQIRTWVLPINPTGCWCSITEIAMMIYLVKISLESDGRKTLDNQKAMSGECPVVFVSCHRPNKKTFCKTIMVT